MPRLMHMFGVICNHEVLYIMKYIGLLPPSNTKHGGRGYKQLVNQSKQTIHRVYNTPDTAFYIRYRTFSIVR